jgi:hypothetical protein
VLPADDQNASAVIANMLGHHPNAAETLAEQAETTWQCWPGHAQSYGAEQAHHTQQS